MQITPFLSILLFLHSYPHSLHHSFSRAVHSQSCPCLLVHPRRPRRTELASNLSPTPPATFPSR
ncbi:hypothetical protein PRIPAC_72141 [Pristionchus pacificus]|uniref:Uncharacterized protein n=1 Tax=Pristionchus pacificus TaxID=54126 RepID=A0A2A6C5I0_PRIPA|nr:hypothetical protein PRIPAC_72141 [Pristionchus pacificus]|eukprot:PDM73399.1 hypothetical protein PRIPAC_40755 [Pristionchus pacificus]